MLSEQKVKRGIRNGGWGPHHDPLEFKIGVKTN
jgi:hypothetical protein